ncbi:transporter substrate-binding domain-containing protein [Vibrio profundum]|uniref:substrate-binding periplasmic protein n=1 Tax=Vibrio profundum TaxID=2910247 RepID=UPI003D100A60
MRLLIAYSVTMFFLISPSVNGEEKKITAVCSEHTPPFCYAGANGQPSGILVDIYKEIAVRMDTLLEVKLVPVKRVSLLLFDGTSDIGNLVYSQERAKHVRFLDSPVYGLKVALYGKQPNRFTYQSISDLYGKTIGKRRGYYLSSDFAKAVEQKNIEEFNANSNMQLLNLLKKGRVKYVAIQEDFILMNKDVLPQDISFLGYLTTDISIMLAISKRSNLSEQYEKVNETFAAIKNDGTLDSIITRYIPK